MSTPYYFLQAVNLWIAWRWNGSNARSLDDPTHVVMDPTHVFRLRIEQQPYTLHACGVCLVLAVAVLMSAHLCILNMSNCQVSIGIPYQLPILSFLLSTRAGGIDQANASRKSLMSCDSLASRTVLSLEREAERESSVWIENDCRASSVESRRPQDRPCLVTLTFDKIDPIRCYRTS